VNPSCQIFMAVCCTHHQTMLLLFGLDLFAQVTMTFHQQQLG